MDKVDKILENFEDLIINYKHLFKKLDDLKITELREKMDKDFIEMRKDFGTLMIDPENENIDIIEEKHRKIYNENHFKFESLTTNNEEEILILKNTIKSLTNDLNELTAQHEKEVKKKKKIPYNDEMFLKELENNRMVVYSANANNRNSYGELTINKKVHELMIKYDIDKIYLTCTDSRYKVEFGTWPYYSWRMFYTIHTKSSLLNKYPFLTKDFDMIFHIKYESIYLHDNTFSNDIEIFQNEYGFQNRFLTKDCEMRGNMTITNLYE